MENKIFISPAWCTSVAKPVDNASLMANNDLATTTCRRRMRYEIKPVALMLRHDGLGNEVWSMKGLFCHQERGQQDG